jgi:hypothetical protein
MASRFRGRGAYRCSEFDLSADVFSTKVPAEPLLTASKQRARGFWRDISRFKINEEVFFLDPK